MEIKANNLNKAQHAKLHQWLLNHYINRALGHHFKMIKNNWNLSLNTKDIISQKNMPIFYIANHFSWWDGFIAWKINQEFFKKTFYLAMDPDQLNHYPFFNKTGAFAFFKNGKKMLQSCLYLRSLLAQKEGFICFFPQGKLHSIYQDNIHFKKGLSFITKDENVSFWYLLAAHFIDYLQYPKPTLTSYLCLVSSNESSKIADIYQTFYQECRQQEAQRCY